MTKQPDSDKEPEDDVRRRFREALERKKSKPAEAHEGIEGGGKSSGATASEKSQRMFRRKSGG
jgi:hypothetical protein